MNKLGKLIGEMSVEDVKLLKRDLDNGNIHKLIDKKMESGTGSCPVCGMVVRKDKGIYLEFGKEIRKRAYFDELDCLRYFLERMK